MKSNNTNKVKHNKIKNTGLLFEVLIRNFSIDVLNNRTGNVPKSLIVKYFTSNTELGKELSIYNVLSETKGVSDSIANSIIESSIQLRKTLNESKLKNEKYNLIKEITNNYNIKEFFNIKLSNYKLFASCYKLLEFNIANDTPSELINSRVFILETLTNKNEKPDVVNDSLKLFLEQDKDTRVVAVRQMIKNFNENYIDNLNEEQSKLINLYINQNTNSPEFKDNINKMLINVLSEIKKHKKIVNDDILLIKIDEVCKTSEKIKNNKMITEQNITTIMQLFDLLSTLKKLN